MAAVPALSSSAASDGENKPKQIMAISGYDQSLFMVTSVSILENPCRIDNPATGIYNRNQSFFEDKSMTSPNGRESPPEHQAKVSVLGTTVVLQGDISGQEDLIIRGQVRGKISLPGNDLMVAEGGLVEAEVRVRSITVRGEVNGNIVALGKVTIERTGRVRGDLSASIISIEDGAQFKGSVKVVGNA
jgi:cytoskeletal protein CcmA (bactofilin family)